jgi:hypothetical protein
MHVYWFMLGVLCVWRITHLLHAEDGPGDLLVRLREKAGNGFAGKLLDCFYCLSLWVAAPFALFIPETRLERFLWWPALSAAAILLERWNTPSGSDAPPIYFEEPDLLRREEEKETTNVVLRSEESSAEQSLPITA